jgi:phosphoserine aminotransferase
VTQKPDTRPANPNFSSGPCAKRPGWDPDALKDALVGRSHRSGPGKAKLKEVIDRTRAILDIPADYRIGIVPASDTGAVEMALWSLLGPRGVDMLAWESFGKTWVSDVIKQLKLTDVQAIEADYGLLPDLTKTAKDRDIVFTWNGTTSGVRVPNADWIAEDRSGLTICDATSAAFAMSLPWDKLDVTTWSWQKVLGGEGAHGMIVLSPRAVERLETHTPAWPMPKIFRMTKGGELIDGIFAGETINTPSMLCVEDALDALRWAEAIGGAQGMIDRSQANLAVIQDWVERTDWIEFLPVDPTTYSNTSICLKLSGLCPLEGEARATAPKRMASLLDKENVAKDINGYRDAPAGLRIWGGATVEASDTAALMPWLDWAYTTIAKEG